MSDQPVSAVAHSPLPWRYFSGTRSIWTNHPTEAQSVCVMAGPRGNSMKQRANADLILRCVNVHDELVAALQSVQRVFAWEGSLPRPDDVPDANELHALIDKALARAEGREG